ncbi:MAG TPA: phytanoyl-CoA dioxygenase family protein [Allosphingosinicella sp.]
MRITFGDEERHRALIDRGYCAAPLLDAGEIAHLREEVARLRPSGRFDTSPLASILYHASFLDPDLDYRRRALELIRDAMAPKLLQLLPEYRPIAGGLLVKAPGTGEVGLHCDWTSSRDLADVNVAIWCPLVDVDDCNGALRVVTGSHKLVANISAARLGGYWNDYEDELKGLSEPVPLKAGEALFYDVSLLHWSKTNRSEAPRPAVSLLCVHREAQPVLYVANEDCGRLEVFDMPGDALMAHSPADLFTGNVKAQSLGTIANPNRKVPLREFKRRLAQRRGTEPASGWPARIGKRLARLIGG